MANFNTHLAVGSVASGLCATVAMAGNAVPQHHLLTLTLAGIIGSVLPDIDLEKAIPSRMLFGALGVVFAFVALFSFKKQYSIAELWLAWLSVYLGMRYGIFAIFHRRTKHRGIFHSLLAGAFFAVLTAVIFTNVLNEEPLVAWFAGFFVFIGYIVHLSLDEMYSVDFEGKLFKRSFGSALKLFDYNSIRSSMMMATAFAAVLLAAPSGKDFLAVIKTQDVLLFLQNRMLPKEGWFETRMVHLEPQQQEGQPVQQSADAATTNAATAAKTQAGAAN